MITKQHEKLFTIYRHSSLFNESIPVFFGLTIQEAEFLLSKFCKTRVKLLANGLIMMYYYQISPMKVIY